MPDTRNGTLRLVTFHQKGENPHGDYAILHAFGAPPTMSLGWLPRCTDEGAGDELGDYECKDVPTLPNESGLWVLVWPWRIIRHPEDVGDTTAKYSRGLWRRPTLLELHALTTTSESGQ